MSRRSRWTDRLVGPAGGLDEAAGHRPQHREVHRGERRRRVVVRAHALAHGAREPVVELREILAGVEPDEPADVERDLLLHVAQRDLRAQPQAHRVRLAPAAAEEEVRGVDHLHPPPQPRVGMRVADQALRVRERRLRPLGEEDEVEAQRLDLPLPLGLGPPAAAALDHGERVLHAPQPPEEDRRPQLEVLQREPAVVDPALQLGERAPRRPRSRCAGSPPARAGAPPPRPRRRRARRARGGRRGRRRRRARPRPRPARRGRRAPGGRRRAASTRRGARPAASGRRAARRPRRAGAAPRARASSTSSRAPPRRRAGGPRARRCARSRRRR